MQKSTFQMMVALTIGSATVLSTAQSVFALAWNWKYRTQGVEAGGALFTTDVPDANGFYVITSIAGQRNGEKIVSLLNPGTGIPGNEPYVGDNLLRQKGPQLTQKGFGFSTATGKFANLYFADFTKPAAYQEVYSAPPFLTGFEQLGAEDREGPIEFTATPIAHH